MRRSQGWRIAGDWLGYLVLDVFQQCLLESRLKPVLRAVIGRKKFGTRLVIDRYCLETGQARMQNWRRHPLHLTHTVSSNTTLLHPFNSLFSRTIWVSRYQKGKNPSRFKWGRRWWGLGMAVALARPSGPYANHLLLALDRQPHQHLNTQCSQAGRSSWRPTNSVKSQKAKASSNTTPQLAYV